MDYPFPGASLLGYAAPLCPGLISRAPSGQTCLEACRTVDITAWCKVSSAYAPTGLAHISPGQSAAASAANAALGREQRGTTPCKGKTRSRRRFDSCRRSLLKAESGNVLTGIVGLQRKASGRMRNLS